jgi:hypothetical protein
LAGGALFGVTAGKEPGEGGITVDVATNVLLAGLILQVRPFHATTMIHKD